MPTALRPFRNRLSFAPLPAVALPIAVAVGCGGRAGAAGAFLTDAQASRGSVQDATAITDASAADSDELDVSDAASEVTACSFDGQVDTHCNCFEVDAHGLAACAPDGIFCIGRVACECADAQWHCIAAP
jgi:hypothetical protein